MQQLEGCRDAALVVPDGSLREESGVVEQQVLPSERETESEQQISTSDGFASTYNTRLGHGRLQLSLG